MKITIIDGCPDTNEAAAFGAYLDETVSLLESSGHLVVRLRLAKMRLRHCTGCWSCWVKTPGRCAQDDDTATIIREYLGADLVLFSTPLRLGFMSALSKTLLDKLVALFLPHIELHRGEFVHALRYDAYPDLGCILHAGELEDDDLKNTTEYFRRYAFHFRTAPVIEADTGRSPKEISDAIDGIQRLSASEEGQHLGPPRRPHRGLHTRRAEHGGGALPQRRLAPQGRG